MTKNIFKTWSVWTLLYWTEIHTYPEAQKKKSCHSEAESRFLGDFYIFSDIFRSLGGAESEDAHAWRKT